MNHTLIIYGIQAVLRAAQAGADLYAEHARDRNVFLPDINLSPDTKETQLRQFLDAHPDIAEKTPGIAGLWDKETGFFISSDSSQLDAACAIMLQYKAQIELKKAGKDKKTANYEAKMLAGGRMIEQWRAEKEPPSPIIRFALTLTDIGLEFVSSNPSITGLGSRGEKLIAAFAGNLSALIPDTVDKFGNKEGLADRILGIFLRAGLGTLSNNCAMVFNDKDVETLFKGVVEPIVQNLPNDISEQFEYRTLVDALAGPSAEAVFKLLGENTDGYLGKEFANEKALGAVTSAVFDAVKSTFQGGSIVDIFSEQGVIRLYQAALGVVVEQPALFIDVDETAESKLFKALLNGSAEILKKYPDFHGPMGADLTAMVVKTVGQHAHALMKLNPDDPWENIAKTVLEQTVFGLAEIFEKKNEKGSLEGALKALGKRQIIECGRMVLEQAVLTPRMAGIKESEIQPILSGLAQAMAADENLLLSPEAWLQITAIAAKTASANPGRLFNPSFSGDGNPIAVTVMSAILNAAGRTWRSNEGARGTLLFGETLKSVLEAALSALAGNIEAVSNNPKLVGTFMEYLTGFAKENPDKMGSDGLIKVFRTSIGKVLGQGELPTKAQIINILSTQEI